MQYKLKTAVVFGVEGMKKVGDLVDLDESQATYYLENGLVETAAEKPAAKSEKKPAKKKVQVKADEPEVIQDTVE
jgi:hypothetical protein